MQHARERKLIQHQKKYDEIRLLMSRWDFTWEGHPNKFPMKYRIFIRLYLAIHPEDVPDLEM